MRATSWCVKDSDCAQPHRSPRRLVARRSDTYSPSLRRRDPSLRGALIDRNSRLWWLDLASPTYSRSNLSAYDAFYRERVDALSALDEWFDLGGVFPTRPIAPGMLDLRVLRALSRQLEAIDDVSLTRFTSIDQQSALRAHGIHTRNQLARLDPVRPGRRAPSPRPAALVGVEDASDESSTASMN